MSRSPVFSFLGLWARDRGLHRLAVGEVTTLRARAGRHLDARDLEAACAVTDALLAVDPDDAWGRYVRATTQKELGDLVACRDDARRLLALSPEQLRRGNVEGGKWLARAWYLVGYASLALDDEPEAEAALAQVEALVDAQPADRGRARFLRWDFAGALEDLRPAPPYLLRQAGRFDEALAALGASPGTELAPAWQVRARSERWQLQTIRGDEAGADAELAALPDRDERWGLVGVAAALAGDRAGARAAFERATSGTLHATDAWQWAVSLGLRSPGQAPPPRDAWQEAITARLLGGLDDDELLAVARAASGPRLRAARLHEAHAGLALLAHGRGDVAAELHHLRQAAVRGDLGGLLDAWIHGRARRLGSPLEHRSATPEA